MKSMTRLEPRWFVTALLVIGFTTTLTNNLPPSLSVAESMIAGLVGFCPGFLFMAAVLVSSRPKPTSAAACLAGLLVSLCSLAIVVTSLALSAVPGIAIVMGACGAAAMLLVLQRTNDFGFGPLRYGIAVVAGGLSQWAAFNGLSVKGAVRDPHWQTVGLEMNFYLPTLLWWIFVGIALLVGQQRSRPLRSAS